MKIDIRKILQDAAQNSLEEACKNRTNFITQLGEVLKNAGLLTCVIPRVGEPPLLRSEIHEKGPGFQIILDRDNGAKFSANGHSATPLCGDFKIDTASGKTALVEMVGQWIGENDPKTTLLLLAPGPRVPVLA